MGMKLFDDDGGSDGEAENIQIDQDFARRYEHNKKREDLQRLAELEKKGVVNSELDSDSDGSSSSEEEVAAGGKQLFDALIRVRNQDPSLKDKEAKLFASDTDSDGGDGDEKVQKKKKKKPVYLKDVVSKQLIEEGPEFSEEEVVVKSHAEEQEELRQEFLKAVEEQDEEDGGELFREKIVSGGDEDNYDDDEIVEKLDEYFGPDDKLDKDSIFLKDYFRNKMWEDKGSVKVDAGVSEDEEEIEKQEEYERQYNFRFEENAGDRVLGYSRVVEGSVRKTTNARKLQRERKEERMALAEFERKEELKHLKNVKKKEINEKLRKIRETAGIGDDGAWVLEVDDLDDEFNPDEHDKKMKKAFDDSYYGAEDVDPDFGSEDEKPDFDKEDELLGLSKGWDDVEAPGDGFLLARERILKQKKGEDNHESADGEDGKRKKKRKRKLSEVEKAVKEQLMDEYHKLEYEDTIGDLKTRFKYRAVEARKYGLKPTEILTMDDKELNQYVPLKKLAPYREKEWKVPKLKMLKYKNPEVGASEVTTDKHIKISGAVEPNSSVSEKQELEINSGSSRRVKRKRRQAELKVPLHRLMAFGKISNKPKGKKKP